MKILPLIAAAAVAVVTMPVTAAPAAAAGVDQIHVSIGDHHRHHGWRQVCRWEGHGHHRHRVCHRERW